MMNENYVQGRVQIWPDGDADGPLHVDDVLCEVTDRLGDEVEIRVPNSATVGVPSGGAVYVTLRLSELIRAATAIGNK